MKPTRKYDIIKLNYYSCGFKYIAKLRKGQKAMRKKIAAIALILAALVQVISTGAFSDLTNYAWCEQYVTYLSERGLLLGTSADTFSPELPVTRGDFAVLAVRIFGLEADNIPDNFADVTPDAYYYQSVGILKLYQLVSGIDQYHYAPQQNMQRQDMAVLLWRIMNRMGYYGDLSADTLLNQYLDGWQVASYAKEAVAYLAEKGIMTGNPGGSLYPEGIVTRAEMAAMMARVHRYIEGSYTN